MRPVQKMYGVIGGGVIVDLLPAVPSQCIVIERATGNDADDVFVCLVPRNKLCIFAPPPSELVKLRLSDAEGCLSLQPDGCIGAFRAAHALRSAVDAGVFPQSVKVRAAEIASELATAVTEHAMHLRCTRAARVIQTVWLQCYYTPAHPMCRRRLLRELERLQNTPKM